LIATFLLFIVTVLTALICTGLGPTHIPILSTAQVIAEHILHPSLADNSDIGAIVWQIRVPRVLLEILTGASLAAAGAAFQALLRNPLAEPYTIGVSSGASVGVSIVVALGLEGALRGYAGPAAALLGAMAALIMVYSLSRIGGRVDVRSLLLSGVVAGAFLWAAQMVLFRLAHKNDDEILAWMMGTLSSARWSDIQMLGVIAPIAMILTAFQSRAMNIYSLGEDSARHLGLEPERFKLTIIFLGSLLTACAVSISGIIGFVGLIVPHLCRKLLGTPDNRYVMIASMFGGALMLILADSLTRLSFGGELIPVGASTALLGAPFFFHLLRNARNS
jgi:iron complex transport system permease protein